MVVGAATAYGSTEPVFSAIRMSSLKLTSHLLDILRDRLCPRAPSVVIVFGGACVVILVGYLGTAAGKVGIQWKWRVIVVGLWERSMNANLTLSNQK
jgi:hypothetical protein